MGKHSITAGIDLMHQHAAENTAYSDSAVDRVWKKWNRLGRNSFPALLVPVLVPNRLFPMGGYLADYMVGAGSGYMQARRRDCRCGRLQIGPFIQDDWKILPT